MTTSLLQVACILGTPTTVIALSAMFHAHNVAQHQLTAAATVISLTAANTSQASDEANSFCENGTLLPQMYFLGVQKAGTTSFAWQLKAAGVEVPREMFLQHGKEWHFFDRHDAGRDEEKQLRMKREWLHELPGCSARDGRRLLADFTIVNLGLVPLPPGTRATGTHWGWWGRKENRGDEDLDLPRTLAALYPQTLQRQLRFVVVLRDPAARMVSAWYHANQTGFAVVCSDCKGASLAASLDRTLMAAKKSPPEYKDWLWHSMYARQLDRWLRVHEPEQFYVVRFQDAINGASAAVCRRILSWLRMPADCEPADDAHRNARDHPSLADEETANPEVFQRLRDLMEPENRHLANLLSDGILRGMRLEGRVGPTAKSWLEAGW